MWSLLSSLFLSLPPLRPVVFWGGAGEQGERGGNQLDGGGQGPAPQPQLERCLSHRERRPLRTLRHPHQPHHQWGHVDRGQGETRQCMLMSNWFFDSESLLLLSIFIQLLLGVSICSEVPDVDDCCLLFTELYIVSQIEKQLELILKSATVIFLHFVVFIYFSGLFGSSLARGFRDEPCLHADRGGIQSGPPGKRHPVLTSVHSRSYHLSSGRERATCLPGQP